MGSIAEGQAFDDLFTIDHIQDEWLVELKVNHAELHTYLSGVHAMGDAEDHAYLVYMAMRLIECRRILKPAGSIYLHCDHTMSAYLKLLLDVIFGVSNFRNEIIWAYNRFSRRGDAFPQMSDSIFLYSKTEISKFNPLKTDPKDTKRYEKGYHIVTGKTGSKLLVYDATIAAKKIEEATQKGMEISFTESKNPNMGNVWTDIPILNPMAKERTGWKTQKPVNLYRRLINASSDPGDLVVDPFSGCTTTLIAAEQEGRRWAGTEHDPELARVLRERFDKETQLDMLKMPPTINVKLEVRTDSGADESDMKYIYIISNPAFVGYYKVGTAGIVANRLANYQTSDPHRRYQSEFEYLTPHWRTLESYIHKKFPSKGEWVQGKFEDIKRSIEEYKP